MKYKVSIEKEEKTRSIRLKFYEEHKMYLSIICELKSAAWHNFGELLVAVRGMRTVIDFGLSTSTGKGERV